MGTVAGETVTKTVGPAAYFGCKVHKGCSLLSARKFLLFRVLCHHFCVSCTAQAWPSSFTPVWPFQGKLWWSWTFFLYSKALDKLFPQTLFCPLKWILSPNSRIVFYFYSWFFSQIKQCVYEFHQMLQMEFLKWHFSMWLDWSFFVFFLIFLFG